MFGMMPRAITGHTVLLFCVMYCLHYFHTQPHVLTTAFFLDEHIHRRVLSCFVVNTVMKLIKQLPLQMHYAWQVVYGSQHCFLKTIEPHRRKCMRSQIFNNYIEL